jgi:hypothetical protein
MSARVGSTGIAWGIGALVLLISGRTGAEPDAWQFSPEHQLPAGPNFVTSDQATAAGPE